MIISSFVFLTLPNINDKATIKSDMDFLKSLLKHLEMFKFPVFT